MAYRFMTLSQLGVVSKGQPSWLKHGGKATSEYAQARAAKHAAGQQRGRLIARQRKHEGESLQHAANAQVFGMKPERAQMAANAAKRSELSANRAAGYQTGINTQLAEGTKQAAKSKAIEDAANKDYPLVRDPEDANFQRNKQQQMRRQRQLRGMRSNARSAWPEQAEEAAPKEKRKNLWGPAVGAGLAATAAGGAGYGAYRYHRSWQQPRDRRQEKQHAI